MKKIILFFTALLAISCLKHLDVRYPLLVRNNSQHNIGLYFALGGVKGIYYPDTIPPISNDGVRNPITFNRYSFHSSTTWEHNYSKLPQDTMSVFVFHSDTLATYSWEEVREEYKVLIRYDLSLDDLERLDFELSYPPDSRMQGVKMYPR